MRLLPLLCLAASLGACSAKPKQCDPVGCIGSVGYATTVTLSDRKGDYTLTLCRNGKCGTTTFVSSPEGTDVVPLSDPVSGQLVVRGPASGPTTLELALQGGEATFAQGDVWEITFVDTTRRATLLHVTSTPTAYTLHEPAGAGCGGCLSGTIVAR